VHPSLDDLLSLLTFPPSVGFDLARFQSTAGRWFWVVEEGRKDGRTERFEVLDPVGGERESSASTPKREI